MTQIIVDITSCKDCPHHKEKRIYTADSWERAYDWFCCKKLIDMDYRNMEIFSKKWQQVPPDIQAVINKEFNNLI